jgi:hypothetical protein
MQKELKTMEEYFSEKGVSNFISITNIGNVSDDQLSSKLSKEISQKYSNIRIYENSDLENRKLSIDDK